MPNRFVQIHNSKFNIKGFCNKQLTTKCNLSSSSQLKKEEGVVVTQEDLEHLCHLVDRTDGGPLWKHVMDRSTPNMSYQAWQRDPEV